jgi:hypothetical protein
MIRIRPIVGKCLFLLPVWLLIQEVSKSFQALKTPLQCCPESAFSSALPAPVLKINKGINQKVSSDLELLTYNFTSPADVPPAPGDVFAPEWTSVLEAGVNPGAPVISSFSAQADPDRTVILHGAAFTAKDDPNSGSDTRVWIYSQTTANDARLTTGRLMRETRTDVSFQIDPAAPYGMYMVWAENTNGIGYPVRINAANAWWVGPDHAIAGSSVNVYGQNLSYENKEVVSYVYLRPWSAATTIPSVSARVTRVNPYKVTFEVPANAARGDYEVWVHNGKGGDYGWSGPLKLRVDGSDPYAWKGRRLNVMDYGAAPDGRDSTAAIQATLNAARDGDVVYFPAGRFRTSTKLMLGRAVSVEGVDSATSVIEVASTTLGPGAEGAFQVTAFPSRVRNLGFISRVLLDLYAAGGVLFFDARAQSSIPSGVIVENCAFELPAGVTYTAIGGAGLNDVRISNSLFKAGLGIYIDRTSQVFISGNKFLGNWPDTTYSGLSAIESSASNELDINQNVARSASRATGETLTRFFVAQGHSHGLTSNNYVAENLITDTGCARLTCGENIMFETPGTLFTGRAAVRTATTLTFFGVNWQNNYMARDERKVYVREKDQRPAFLFIQSGPGEGQYRRILANSANTITIDRPWDVAPDPNSVYTALTGAYQNVIYKNVITGWPDAWRTDNNIGILAYGSLFDTIIAGNTISALTRGIELSSLVNTSCGVAIAGVAMGAFGNNCPIWNVTVKENVISGVVTGIAVWSRVEDPERSVVGPALLNNIIRENWISDASRDAFSLGDINLYRKNDTWQQNTVLEYNTVNDAKTHVRLLGLQSATFVRGNSFGGYGSYPDSTGIYFDPLSISAYLGDNLYGPAVARTYAGTLPVRCLQLSARTVGFEVTPDISAPVQTIEVRNAGPTALNVTTSSNAPWLTVSPSSSLISDERDVARLQLKVEAGYMEPGAYGSLLLVCADGVYCQTIGVKLLVTR